MRTKRIPAWIEAKQLHGHPRRNAQQAFQRIDGRVQLARCRLYLREDFQIAGAIERITLERKKLDRATTLSKRLGVPPEPRATPYPVESLDVLKWKLDALASLADSDRPVFAFMHLLTPHEPYLFNADCSGREPWWPLSDQGENFEPVGEAYADQVRCLAPLLLETVRKVLDRSRVGPVIVLQSDHGHGRIAVDPLRGFTLSADELSREQLGDRLGVFAAYTFPGADSLVRDDISPVNVLPLILRSLFSEGPSQQPDRSFWSSYQSAFSFTELPAEATRPRRTGLPAAAQLRAAQPLGPSHR